MDRKKLEQVRWLKKELKMWERRLEELYADIALSGQPDDGMPHSVTNKIISPTEDKAIEIAETIEYIQKKKREIIKAVNEVEKFIIELEDPMIRTILEYRCVYGLSWTGVADAMGADQEQTIRQSYSRFVRTLK